MYYAIHMQVTRRSAVRTLVAGAAGVAVGGVAYGYAYERHAIRTVRATLPVSGLPPALEGFTIGLITDLHHGPFVTAEQVSEAADLVAAVAPDLVVLGGDYVTQQDVRYAGPCAEALGRVTAPHGVFAVLGNHDDELHVPAALARQRFAVLKDAATTLRIRNEPLRLAGLRFWTRRMSDIIPVLKPSAATTILLAHDPRRLREAAALAVPAVVSGHTHGGQVVIPGWGSLAARRFPVIAGLGRLDDTRLFVSRGVGTVYVPIRLNCPPEVCILRLVGTRQERE